MLLRICTLCVITIGLLTASPCFSRGGAYGGGHRSSHSSGGSRSGDVYVHGYYRKDGTYVQPYMRSHPDGDPYNNWSTKGNINPYTGKEGTKSVIYPIFPQSHRDGDFLWHASPDSATWGSGMAYAAVAYEELAAAQEEHRNNRDLANAERELARQDVAEAGTHLTELDHGPMRQTGEQVLQALSAAAGERNEGRASDQLKNALSLARKGYQQIDAPDLEGSPAGPPSEALVKPIAPVTIDPASPNHTQPSEPVALAGSQGAASPTDAPDSDFEAQFQCIDRNGISAITTGTQGQQDLPGNRDLGLSEIQDGIDKRIQVVSDLQALKPPIRYEFLVKITRAMFESSYQGDQEWLAGFKSNDRKQEIRGLAKLYRSQYLAAISDAEITRLQLQP